MSLPAAAQQVLNLLQQSPSFEGRNRALLQLGNQLPSFASERRNEQDLVHGCDSQVWLRCAQQGTALHFSASSDARLIRGLLACLLLRANGLTAAELAHVDWPDWLTQLGLKQQLSPSRANGLNAVVQRVLALSRAT
ncbi:SufE family protein [Atopomonas sediminilitoris]|uniref:SufE family protein n=1 Tax=Atopomonas sediminilitoris TaxID=2919919 RepID=UPI001F4EA3A2|nr:SufE family protein [Atopomonas sediminilitoris]MCJ8169750.1 SufE family protein [Atopomonas sediminilitoris]